MALGQSLKDAHDYLSELSVEQLRSLLTEQYRSDDIDVELIKKINAVLESKTEIEHRDPEEAYQDFLENYAGTEPMYEEDTMGFEESEEAGDSKPKHAKRRIRFGLILAAVLVLFLATSVAANAMGLNLWTPFIHWTRSNFGVGVENNENNHELPIPEELKELADALAADEITGVVLPRYIPEGYQKSSFEVESYPGGAFYRLTLSNGSDYIIVGVWSISDGQNGKLNFPKDDEDPEIYQFNGENYYITTNYGDYRAVWFSDSLACSISGVSKRGELLEIIHSIE